MTDEWRCSRFMVSSRRDLETWSKAHFTSKRMERISMLLAWLMSFGRHGAGSGFGWFCEIGQSGSDGLFRYLSKTVQKDDDWGQSSLACSF